MKKRIFAAAMAGLLLCLSCGCSGTQGTAGGGSLDDLEPISITVAHSENGDPTNYMHGAALAFKEYVEAESNGKITVQVSPGGALGDADACMMQVMSGTLEIAGSISDGSISAVYPNYLVFSIPYLFRNQNHALAVFHGDFGQKFWSGFTEATNVLPLCTVSGGFRSTTNSVRPIHTPEDMKGLTIRTMNMSAHMEIMENLGASVTPLSWTELYSALQTGVVDGQENGLPSTMMGNLYEVQDYLTLDEHVWTTDNFVMSKSWYDSLPAEYQRIIDMGGAKMQEVCQRLADVQTELAMEFLPTVMEVYDPTEEEMEQFKEACQASTIDFIRGAVDDEALVDEILAAADQALADLGYVK